jgi:hypothetical protein
LLHLGFWFLLPMVPLSAAGTRVFAAAPSEEPIMLEVASAEVCIFVERLKPVDPGRRFPVGVGKLYCFSRISNIEKETEIHHVWYRGTEKRLDIALPVRPPSWRTYSWKRIQRADGGEWRVDICDAAGNVLKTVAFIIIPPDASTF